MISNFQLLLMEGPDRRESNAKWRRPSLPPLDPKTDAITFQQMETDYYLGKCSGIHACYRVGCTRSEWDMVVFEVPLSSLFFSILSSKFSGKALNANNGPSTFVRFSCISPMSNNVSLRIVELHKSRLRLNISK